MSVLSILPPAVRTYVHDFDARARRLALLRGVGLALASFAVWTLVWCGVDRVAQLARPVRGTLLAAGGLAVLLILWRPVRGAMRRGVDWVDAAGRIERHDPQFGQRLVTVTSRVLGPAEHRGSDDMLRELLRDVDRQAATQDAAGALPLRRVGGPWAAFVLAVLAFAVLARVPGLEMGVLATRFVAPWADVLPVTTTRLDVPTGSRDVVQSAALRIEADVARLEPLGLVSLFVSEDDGRHWSRFTMEPVAGPPGTAEPRRAPAATPASGEAGAAGAVPGGGGTTRFAFTLASVDRDLRYYVTAGDATSRTHSVRVRRPPAVERFAVHYEYPAHTGRDALTVVNGDGLIEAPVGTRATLTITATEPLDHALLTVAGEKILMDRLDAAPGASGAAPTAADASRVRRATFVVRRNGRYALDLISDRKVPGEGPAGTTLIRAMPDAKPLARLAQAGGETLRLHPREILPLGVQALDDYGIANLALGLQVNTAAPLELPLELRGDARRQEREHPLDLATLPLEKPLAIGDVVTLVLRVEDRAGQRAASEPLRVLVSPRSVDLTTYRRVAELDAAATNAAVLHDQLTRASVALEEADREAATRSLAYLAALNRANRHLTGASEAATLGRQALFRATANSRSTALSNALANWIDEAQVQSWLAEDLFRRADAPAGMGGESRGLLARSLESTRVTRDELRSVAAGERAAALLVDRENLLAAQRRADATTRPADADARQRLVRTLRRASEDVAAGAHELGLDPAAADLDAQLKARVDAAAGLLAARRPVDFAAAAREWAMALQRDRTQPVALDERLSAASRAEAVRHDADLARARDLLLAARAAGRLEALAQGDPAARSLGPVVFDEYVAALAAVQRGNEANRRPLDGRPAEELTRARDEPERGRQTLAHWAGELVPDLPDAPLAGPPADQSATEDPARTARTARTAPTAAAARDHAPAAGRAARLARELEGEGGTDNSITDATRDAVTPPASGPALLVPATAGATRERGRAIFDTHRLRQTIDGIGHNQQRFRPGEGGSGAGSEGGPGELVGRQGGGGADAIGLTDDAAEVDATRGRSADEAAADPHWRGRAAAAVLSAQEALAAMPQQLAAAAEAFPAWRDAAARADDARRGAAAMPDAARQPAASRTAAQAERDETDAAEQFNERQRAVSPSVGSALADVLEPFAPETDAARDAIGRRLVPALRRLEEASTAGDVAAFARAADEARQSIEAAQRELTRARETLTARDPLVAAKWFARSAFDWLSQSPADLRWAQVRRGDPARASPQAWEQTLDDAAAAPRMQSAFGPPVARAPAAVSSTRKTVPTTAQTMPADPENGGTPVARSNGPRDWVGGPLRESQPDASAARRETDPAGFEEPLRLYFDALSKGRTEPQTQPAK